MHNNLLQFLRRPLGQPASAQPAASPRQPAPAVEKLKTPVNPLSNAVDPSKLYPLHLDLLMHDLHAIDEVPEMWRVLDATETRLDEHGMEIEFTLVRHGTDLVWRRSVLVSGGRLVRIKAL
jgi:hypothetical protein